MNEFFQNKIAEAILTTKQHIEFTHSNQRDIFLSNSFKRDLEKEFKNINFNNWFKTNLNNTDCVDVAYVDDIQIEQVEDKSNSDSFRYQSAVGTGLFLLGQGVIKKRFYFPNSSAYTSIASKYLSMTLPQKMPFRVFKTKVLRRAIGQAAPYVGIVLIIIDTVKLIIETYQKEQDSKFHFDGGTSGGGGAHGSWN